MPIRFASSTSLCAVVLLLAWADRATAVDRLDGELNRGFTETVQPFLETYCFACHGAEKQKGKLDLRPYTSRVAIAKSYRQWDILLAKLKAGEMPPEEAKRHPTAEQRRRVIDWIQANRKYEAHRNAGDPGPVLARRLSNAEYDYTIHDLTGVDIRPAQEFPVDPANEAGFDNSGESLAMSPALLNKYLEAARRVAEHIAFKPGGFDFAPHPMVTDSDRDKYCVKRIIDFYQRQPTDYAEYFVAAWRFKHRAALGNPKATLAECAAAAHVSPKYLGLVWSMLTGPLEKSGPIAVLQSMWQALPAPSPEEQELTRGHVHTSQSAAHPAAAGFGRLRDFVETLRQKLRPEFTNLAVRGIASGSQPFVLWKDREFVANRLRCRADVLSLDKPPEPDEEDEPPAKPAMDAAVEGAVKRALAVPADAPGQAGHRAACQRFCAVFPDAFYVAERKLIFLKEDKESQGRLLSAGFHLMTGYFRDDAPLMSLVLDEAQQRELDRLWDEFHFITLDPIRQYKDFIFFERAEPPRFMQGEEFDFARSEDKDSTSAAKIRRLAEAYLAKVRRQGGAGTALTAIEDYFRIISDEIRRVEQARVAAEPRHLQALQNFAERAYHRPLSQNEREDLFAFYQGLRDQDGLDHEEAIRDTLTRVLMSPAFCYRADLAEVSAGRTVTEVRGGRTVGGVTNQNEREPRWPVERLSDYALASRLSYFLWSSLPDLELLGHAKSGDLHKPKVLLAQTRRLLQEDRIRRLATEFGGNWLDFRRFEEHNSVDRERFPSFNNELRAAMFEEPIRFFVDVIHRDRSVLDFLNAKDTFVNPVLARHYGMAEPSANEWRQVADAGPFGRGGLLPMSVFLTKNAPGLRTSPVKRGYWVVRRLLGEQIPPPPPKVPELPADESKLGELTLRETLARHREDPSCAGCHARFDAIGLALEGYGPIGEQRTRDLGGRLVDVHANFPGGGEGTGLEGLRDYLNEYRQEEFLDNLCRKLLAYGLGRTLLLSDDVTIDNMRAQLAADGYRFNRLVQAIVTSPQFLTRRVPSGELATATR